MKILYKHNAYPRVFIKQNKVTINPHHATFPKFTNRMNLAPLNFQILFE